MNNHLKIKNTEREPNSLKANKGLIQAERGEIFYRDDLKTTFAYSLIAVAALIVVSGTLLSVGGMGYTFVQQLKK